MYAKILKQYTAEAFFCLLAIDRAVAFAERRRSGGGLRTDRRRRDLALLALVLMLGLAFANAQLFVAPAVLAALALDAVLRRDAATFRALLVTALVVGLWDATYYGVLVAPRLPTAADAYWNAQAYVPARPAEAARVVWDRFGWTLRPALGGAGYAVAMTALALACAVPRLRVAAAAVLLLVAEIAVLSMLRFVAIGQPRILIFLTTALAAFGAAAVGAFVVRACARPLAAAVATLGLGLLVYDFVGVHRWPTLGQIVMVEDAGPLVRMLARERRPEDTVLLHQSTMFIFAYYDPPTPVLDALRDISVGYVPRVPDARVVLVNDQTVVERAATALRTSPRVWFLASRVRELRERRIREQLARLGPTTLDRRRPGAFLLALSRPPPGSPAP
jgi:hypothetical protein